MIHAILAYSQAKISLNWLSSTEEKIAFKSLKLIFAKLFSALVQVSSDLVIITSFVVTIREDHPISIALYDFSFMALM